MRKLTILFSLLLSFTLLAQTTQSPSPNWALDRLDQRTGPPNNSYSYTTTGAGVHVYVVDSGINVGHTEFAGRVTVDADFVFGPSGGGQDCNGHGTAVAGIAAGTTYGVAKGAQIHVLRITGCAKADADYERLVEALAWILRNHVKPAVVNVSYNYDTADTRVATAVTELLQAGVVVVASAGNAPGPLNKIHQMHRCVGVEDCRCDMFYGCTNPREVDSPNIPATVPGVISAGAFTTYSQGSYWERRLPKTRWNPDVYAPGSNLKTATIGSATASTFFSDTSAAAPVVTGVVARYLQSHPTATPAQVRQWVRANATQGTISHVPAWEGVGVIYMAPSD